MTKLTTVGTKKVVEPEIVNGEILPSAKKQGNFDLVSGGRCPHDGAKLGDAAACKGVGATRICESCSHRWYFYKRDNVTGCKCLTCSAEKRKRSADKLKRVADVLNDASEAKPDDIIDYDSNETYNKVEGADESRWASRTSNPLGGVNSVFGGFDSHALPPDSNFWL